MRVFFCVSSQVRPRAKVLRSIQPVTIWLKLLSFFVSTSVQGFFDMSADDSQSVRDSSDHNPFWCRDAFVRHFCQRCDFNDDDTDEDNKAGSTPSTLMPPPSGSSVAVPVNVASYFDTCRLLLKARPFAAMDWMVSDSSLSMRASEKDTIAVLERERSDGQCSIAMGLCSLWLASFNSVCRTFVILRSV